MPNTSKKPPSLLDRVLAKKWWIVAVVVIIGAVWFGKNLLTPKNTQPSYQTAQAETGTLVVSLTGSGQVAAVNDAIVNTQASGKITKVLVANGQVVQAGQVLAELQLDDAGKQKQAAAYSTYLSAVNSEKTAEQAKLTADSSMWSDQKAFLDAQNTQNFKNANTTNPDTKTTYTDLEKQSIDSSVTQTQKAFIASQTKYLEADADVQAAKAAITSSWLAYQETLPVIKAPISGTVTGLSLSTGSMINQNTSNSTSTTSSLNQKFANIVSNIKPSVTINLTEIDVPKVQIGDKATLKFDAFPDKTYTGQVISIDTAGVVSSGVTTYPTVIQLDTTSPEIYPNMSATANVIIQIVDNALLVPNAAIQNQNGQSVVHVLKNGQAQTVSVQVGAASDTQTQITSGLSEGDTVITNFTSARTGAITGTGTSPFSRTFGGGGGGGAFRLGGGRGG